MSQNPQPGWVARVVWFYKHETIRAVIITAIVLSDLVLIWFAFFKGPEGISWPSCETVGQWINRLQAFSARQRVSLIAPAAALTLAYVAHLGDGKWGGHGIRDLTQKMRGSAYNLETDVIAASMTKQSVLAAIASILIVLIQAAPKTTDYLLLVWLLATCGFVFSILLLLISMVCYDYASRFNWSSFYKAELVGKALRFDIWSWYFLLTSLVLSIALISPRLSILGCLFAGILMWWYYFFRPKKAGTDLYIRGLSEMTVNAADLKNARDFYHDKLGLKVLDDQNDHAYLEVGDWGRIKLVQVSSDITAQEIVFTVSPDDFKTVLETLTRNKVPHTPSEGAARSISIDAPDGHKVKICAVSWAT